MGGIKGGAGIGVHEFGGRKSAWERFFGRVTKGVFVSVGDITDVLGQCGKPQLVKGSPFCSCIVVTVCDNV